MGWGEWEGGRRRGWDEARRRRPGGTSSPQSAGRPAPPRNGRGGGRSGRGGAGAAKLWATTTNTKVTTRDGRAAACRPTRSAAAACRPTRSAVTTPSPKPRSSHPRRAWGQPPHPIILPYPFQLIAHLFSFPFSHRCPQVDGSLVLLSLFPSLSPKLMSHLFSFPFSHRCPHFSHPHPSQTSVSLDCPPVAP